MLLADWQIKAMSLSSLALLTPCNLPCLNPYGYDLTLGNEFLIPKLSGAEFWHTVDPFNPPIFSQEFHYDFIVVPPHNFVLGASVEYVRLPRDIMAICMGRSTYARVGIITNVTPLEAGWEGVVTIEISNTSPFPVMVHVGKGIVQAVFLRGEQPPERDYVQKGGRYQGQTQVTQGKAE